MNAPRLLVTGNEVVEVSYTKEMLEVEGYIVDTAASEEEVLQYLQHTAPAEVVILDLELDATDQLQLLEQCKKIRPEQKILIIARVGKADQVVQALKLGADDFITKPFPDSRLRDAVCRAAGPGAKASDQAINNSDDLEVIESLDDEHFFLAASPAMKQIRAHAALVARVDMPVLLLGESGAGKEIIARLIHKLSPRANGPLLKVNCAALPDDLLESELFGYEAGAFTGARASKPGKFELCNRGTVLLDEIGEVSPWLQAKLLHVLQDGKFSRLGGRTTISVDVRILAATNIDMEHAIATKAFREDLLYRLNAFTVQVPPLRERPEEIPLLLAHFMKVQAARLQRPPLPLSDKLVQECLRYQWPGNLRELANVVKRYLVFGDENLVIAELNSRSCQPVAEIRNGQPVVASWGNLKSRVGLLRDQAELREIQRALENANWNRRIAAAQLQISYRTLISKMKRYKLTPPPEQRGGWLRYG